MSEFYSKISELVISGGISEIPHVTKQALESGLSAQNILHQGLLAGMDVVGQRFKACEMFIPEVLRSAKCMNAAMTILKPHLSEADTKGAGTIVIGTVEGDLHDIGKNLVGMMLEGAGFKVIDLGIEVKPQKFAEAVKEHEANLLGMSALLTTTMPKMGETIQALKDMGLRHSVKVMIGGAPVTQDFADKIGADAYGPNATVAVEKARALAK